MRWRKCDLWKAGIVAAGVLLLILMTWVPVSAAGAHQGASISATPGTVTVQSTPTVDPAITAETAQEQLTKLQRDNDRSFQAWFWNASATFGTIVAALFAIAGVLWTARMAQDKNLADSHAERERRVEEQRRWLKNQEAEREKRAEERFQSAVEGLGSASKAAQAGAAIMLRTFLQKDYEQFYQQTFDLAVTHLRLRYVDPTNTPEPLDPGEYVPLDSLSQALITVFKESFPLTRNRLKKENSQFNPPSLDASLVQLDSAYLDGADLKDVWMRVASLKKARLRGADLSGANLRRARLNRAFLDRATLSRANLSKAHFNGAHLSAADLSEADLSGANLEDASELQDTKLHKVKGLDDKQRAICKAKGAIIDADPTTSSPS